jgi:hypothetical protein
MGEEEAQHDVTKVAQNENRREKIFAQEEDKNSRRDTQAKNS